MGINDPKIPTQIAGVVVRPVGTMNQDLDKRYLDKGNFIDSLNTRAVTTAGGTTLDREIILGNEAIYAIDPLFLQNKTIAIRFNPSIGAGTITTRIYDANRNLIATINTPYLAVSGGLIADAVVADINAAFPVGGISLFASASYSALKGDCNIFFLTPAYWEFYVEVDWTAGTFEVNPAVFTTQESIDSSLLGEWYQIGKYDLEGDLYTWWTTQRNEVESYGIVELTPDGSVPQQIIIETALPHNIPIGTTSWQISVTGTPYDNVNGVWMVNVLDATHVVLLQSVWNPAWPNPLLSVGQINVYINGIGEIEHAKKNVYDGTWNFVRMVRAKQLNFRTKHGIKAYCEKNALRMSLWWTDDYNAPRLIYVYNIGTTDCLLNHIDPANIYELDTIGDQSIAMLSAASGPVSFEWTGQIKSGGAVLSGNNRYAVRFLTETLSATQWIPPGMINPTSAYSADPDGDAHAIIGDDSGVGTGKINNFRLQGALLGIFKYVELAVVNYQDTGITGEIVKRELITSNDMILQHTGWETDSQDLDVGTISQILATYIRAKSIDALDGRIILSNLQSDNILDFSDWTATWEHSLLKQELPDVGDPFNAGGGNPYKFGEYMDPGSVYNYAGYMISETYRFGAMFRLKDGSLTPVYHIQDIPFDEDALFPRRNAALANGDITDNANGNILVPYIRFENIDLNFIVNDQPVGELIDEIYIMRVECVPEVLATGVCIKGVNGYNVVTGGTISDESFYYSDAGGNPTQYGEFPFAGGLSLLAGLGNSTWGSSLYAGWASGTAAIQPQFLSFYSSDIHFGNTSLDYQSGDQIINFGAPPLVGGNPDRVPAPACDVSGCIGTSPATDNWSGNHMRQYAGEFPATTGPESLTVDALINLGPGASGTISAQTYCKNYWIQRDLTDPCYSDFLHLNTHGSPVIHVTSTPSVLTSSNDYGVFYAQYFRIKVDKYGNAANSKYVSTGAILDVSTLGVTTGHTIDTFGGDVFTQKNFIKNRYAVENTTCGTAPGEATEISWYGQNRVNAQMYRPPVGITNLYPYGNDLTVYLNTLGVIEPQYNRGYNIAYFTGTFAAYDPNASYNTDFPVRFIWSQPDDPESSTDFKRHFLPLDFKDGEYKSGEIVHHKVLNGELFSWQPDQFVAWYWDTNAVFSTQGGAEVVVGSGSLMARPPRRLSQYGCSDPFGVIIGVASQGGDTAYWICQRKFAFVRYGYDGTQDKGTIAGMDSWFRNHLNLVYGKTTPYDDEGIHGVWNHMHKEAIITCRSWRSDLQEWREENEYYPGLPAVYWGTGGSDDVPLFWNPLQFSGPPNSVEPGTDPDYWEQIPIANGAYYQIWSIVYSEIKNGWDGFVSFHKRIYSEYQNTFLSTQLLYYRGVQWEHNRGNYSVLDNEQVQAYWHGVLNIDPEERKSYYGIRVKSQIQPARVEFYNELGQSYLVAADFELFEGIWEASIKNDSTVSVANPLGLNDQDTNSFMPGDHLQIKMFMDAGVYQNVFSFTVRTQLRARNRNT